MHGLAIPSIITAYNSEMNYNFLKILYYQWELVYNCSGLPVSAQLTFPERCTLVTNFYSLTVLKGESHVSHHHSRW
jgi:hypothetical protein